VRYTHTQGLIGRAMTLDELFVDSGTEAVVATDKSKY
jgi:hypothetical protein